MVQRRSIFPARLRRAGLAEEPAPERSAGTGENAEPRRGAGFLGGEVLEESG